MFLIVTIYKISAAIFFVAVALDLHLWLEKWICYLSSPPLPPPPTPPPSLSLSSQEKLTISPPPASLFLSTTPIFLLPPPNTRPISAAPKPSGPPPRHLNPRIPLPLHRLNPHQTLSRTSAFPKMLPPTLMPSPPSSALLEKSRLRPPLRRHPHRHHRPQTMLC